VDRDGQKYIIHAIPYQTQRVIEYLFNNNVTINYASSKYCKWIRMHTELIQYLFKYKYYVYFGLKGSYIIKVCILFGGFYVLKHSFPNLLTVCCLTQS
jgi:hypothetical protein